MIQNWPSYQKKKQIDPRQLPEKIRHIRLEGKTIATLNGSFDLLHAGHLHILCEASRAADVLIVALNTDASIQQYKGHDRPIIPLPYRVEMLSALACVDYITWFAELDPREVLSVIKPDVHVNGAEYGENCTEAETVRSHGGKIKIVSLVEGLSTSQIIHKISKLDRLHETYHHFH